MRNSGRASNAVDGSRNDDFDSGSCTHTKNETNPWWRVDLQQSQLVSNLYIVNRADCCGDRLSNFEVRIGDSLANGNDNPKCGTFYSVPEGKGLSIDCLPPLRGRYVNVRIPGSKRILTLCEVEVRVFDEAPHVGKMYSSVYGHALTGHTIRSLVSVPSVMSCVMHCNIVPNCVSFNHEPATGTCQLNSARKNAFLRDFMAKRSYQYFERMDTVELDMATPY